MSSTPVASFSAWPDLHTGTMHAAMNHTLQSQRCIFEARQARAHTLTSFLCQYTCTEVTMYGERSVIAHTCQRWRQSPKEQTRWSLW